jgi:glycosyltransferase involved in cell wall biosynthesis
MEKDILPNDTKGLKRETHETSAGDTGATPSISVIIPAYNVAPYIAETLDSVFSQTFKNFEVIVVNDGSPDTNELDQALAPYLKRIRYFQQQNRGAGAARNRGVQEALGEFVAFLDGDDLWMPDYLEKQIGFLRAGGYDLAYADALLFGDSPLAGKTYMDGAPSHGPVTFVSLVRGECNVLTSGVIARRSALIEAGLFDERLRKAQDFELWTRLARRGARLGYQRKVLLHYRFRENSLSGDLLSNFERTIRVFRHIEDSYDLTPTEREELSRAIELQHASSELAKGKLALLGGRFEEARISLGRAHSILGGFKLRAAVLLVRIAPRFLQRFADWHLRPQFFRRV